MRTLVSGLTLAFPAAFVSLAARAEPDGLYARMEAELGVQQMDFVQRDQTDQAFHPSQSTVRHWTNQGGTAYGAAVAIGGALKPGFVLAARAHLRLVDLRWGTSHIEDAAGISQLGSLDMALELDVFPRLPLPLRLQAGLGPRWTATEGSDGLIACATCVFSFDAVHGMAAYAGIGLQAKCRNSPCVGALLLLDAAYGVGGHSAGAQVYTDGETWIDTFGASLAATLAFE